MGKSIIWYLPEKSGEVPNACSYLRLLGPLYYRSNQSDLNLMELKKASDLFHPRTIGFTTNRTAAFQVPGLLDTLSTHKDSFRFIHWDTDDYSKEIDKDAKEAKYLLLLEEARQFFSIVATHITVSTEGILKSFPSGKNVHLKRNAIPPNVWATSRSKNVSEYLFFGLKAHETSLQDLSDQFGRIKRSVLLESQVKVRVVGQFSSPLHPIFESVAVPDGLQTYPKFAAWLSTKNTASCGIVINQDTSLNLGKSAMKFLEYSSLGIATLSTNHVSITSDLTANVNTAQVPFEDLSSWMLENSRNKIVPIMAQNAREQVLATRTGHNDDQSMYQFFDYLFSSV
jgi:hypothetical protein